jgi:hypothetical protein
MKNYYCSQLPKNNNYESNISEYNYVEDNTGKECYKNKNCDDNTKPFCNLNKCTNVSNLTDMTKYKEYNKNDITYCGRGSGLCKDKDNNYCVAIDKTKPEFTGYCTNDIKTINNSTIICITGDECPGDLVCDKSKNGYSTCVQEINKTCTDTKECEIYIIGENKLKNNFNDVNPYKCCTDFYSKTSSYIGGSYINKLGIKNKTGYCRTSPCEQTQKCLDVGYTPIKPCTTDEKTFNAELKEDNLKNNFKLEYEPGYIGNEEKKMYLFK